MSSMPVFVKIDKYQEVLSMVRLVQKKLDEAKQILTRIHDLKNQEDHQMEIWQNSLAEIEKKIELVDHSLNEPESL